MDFVLAKYAGQIFDMGEHEKRAHCTVRFKFSDSKMLPIYTDGKDFNSNEG